MMKAAFLDLLDAARPGDLDALRLDLGFSPRGFPALLLRGSTWDGAASVVVRFTRVDPLDGPRKLDAAFARLEAQAAESYRPWLRDWRGRVKARRDRIERAAAGKLN